MKKQRRKIDIANYTKNAANNLSMTRLVVYTIISLVLTILLAVTSYQQNYSGTPLIFCIVVLCMISGYTFLNLKALLIKVREK